MAGEQLRISQIGLVARSPEGHAAKGMAIKGHEDLWVEIQANTFRNWVNEHLRSVGMEVRDLASDFCDGTRLCALVEVLQKRKLRPNWIKRPANPHQYLENVTAALTAVSEDGVKLVNIGNVDIVNGNLKLILGLIWSLIVRYQIGRSKFPPRKLMLAWLKAVLPDCRVTNFTTDWNSGLYLSALLDYCEPGLFPHWKHLNANDSVSNCRSAMELARTRFSVPMVLEPEYLASPFLDELSGMTYLSYFMKENSPGTRATLRWVNSQLKDKHVSNFTKDWNDGSVLCSLVSSLGAPAKFQHSNDPLVWENNLNNGINSGRKLGVEPLLRAKDMVDQNVEHLGVMAYAANFQWIPPRAAPSLTVAASCDTHTTRIHTPTTFKIDFLGDDIDPRSITVEIEGPEGQLLDCRLSLDSMGGKGTFTPTHVGMHQITVFNEGEVVKGCPFHIRAMPELSAISYTGMEPCAVGSIVEVLVNSNGARSGNVEVTAASPTGRMLPCPVNERSGVYTATFQPDEPGEWSIAVRHSGELIQGGPFTCFVFDPNGVKLLGLESPAIPESIHNFTIDARGTGGLGKIIVDIVQDRQSLPHTIDKVSDSLYKVSLHTHKPGKYRIYIYFNGSLVKGSPFPLRVGTREQMKAERLHSPSVKVTSSSNHQENSTRYSAFDRINSSHHRINSPVTSHSSSPVGYRGTSPLASPLRSPSLRSPVEKVSPVFRSTNSPINGLRVGGSSPLHSPGFRNSPSPLNSPISRNSPSQNFAYNSSSSIDTSSNVRVSAMLSNLNQRRDSWDALIKTQNVLGESDAKTTGDALQLLPLHRVSSFTIDTDAPLSQISVMAFSPSKHQLNVKTTRSSSQTAVIYLTATEVGEHVIDVKVRDQRVAGAPFRSHAYDAHAIKVGRIPNGLVGQPVEFEIDGSGAGSGNLEILVNGGHVTSFVRNLGNQRFLASFVPHEALGHLVEMKFNGESVPGSPWQVTVMNGGVGSVAPKMAVIGEAVRLVPVDNVASFQISALGFLREDVHSNVISPSKKAVHSSVISEPGGIYRIEFIPNEVGSHLVEVTVAGEKLPAGPLLAKVYNAALIRVTDVASGVVGQPCQFRVDASQAGEGQLEISINEGEVPNHVTVVGGGRCLVSFTPEMTKPHLIDIKFNGETVTGCPFVCSVSDTSRVSVNLSSLELVPVNQVARFHMTVDNSGSAELAVAITGPSCELPVKVTGNVHNGFTAEFTPREVGPHSISVEYNGHPVSGTPFVAKAYDAKRVYVGPLPQGHVGNTLQFTVDASQAGEGNLEITISAQGANIPTQVHPQGNAKFAVSFVPIEPTDHVISIFFNKEAVPGSPFIPHVVGDFPLVTGSSLSHAPLGTDSYFTMSNVAGSLDDIEVNVEGGHSRRLRIY
uniref:Calponin-homology (CH) domain-containing protein n=2 Tax=Clastoptera arizonana TaxID=38151 RepID=A0A1B6E957_9HEMI